MKQVTISSYITPELSYVLGVLYGDGCLRRYTTGLQTRDKNFALFFKQNLEKWSGLKCKFYKYNIQHQRKNWGFVLNNNCYYTLLGSLVVAKKLKDMNYGQIKNSTEENKIMFLRGIFDSEGHVGYYHNKSCSVSRQIFIGMQDKKLLKFCKLLLHNLGINSGILRVHSKKGTKINIKSCTNNKNKIYYSNACCYNFNICGRKNLEMFKQLIGFSIKRKQNILIKATDSYQYPKIFNRRIIEKLYIEKNMCLIQVAKILKCHVETVKKNILRYNLPLRT